jgi:hypothetical protein
MPTAANRKHASTNRLLRGVAQLSWGEFNDFMVKAAALRRPNVGLRLSRQETTLLLKINEGPPAEWNAQFRRLMEKQHAGSLSSDEQKQLLRLTEKMERYDAQRLEWLTALASLRRMPLRALIRSLGIKTPDYV